jgi:outer membrane protein assembly factor BamB
MSNGSKIYEVKCPSCGAPLAMTGERITCNYCGAVLERERPAAPGPAASPQAHERPMIVIQTGHTTVSSRRKSGGSSCLSGVFTLLLLVGIFGAVGWFQFRSQLPAINSLPDLSAQLANLGQLPAQIANSVSVSSLTKIILLPGQDTSSPDFLTYVYNSDAETYALTYVDAVSSTIRWQSPPLKEWYSAQVLPSGGVIYVNDETKLLALNQADGQVLWQTSLADKLSPSCSTCLKLLDNALVALVQGGTVQGFNAQNGQLLWQKTLNFEPGSRLLAAGHQLIIFDRTPDNRNNFMVVVNPANGETTAELTIPECSGTTFDLHHPLLYDESRGRLYVISGNIIGPACVQVWDIAGQKMAQEIVFDGLSLPSDFSEFVSDQTKALLAGDKLYFAAHQAVVSGDGPGVVVSLNLADGTWQALAPSPDYKLIPLAVSDDLLVMRAIRTRGTERSELWALDPAAGQPRWQYVLQAPRWYKEPGSQPAWDWHISAAGLSVLQIFNDPDQMTIETLNPQTGVSAGQKTIPLDDNYFTDIVWTHDAAWVALRNIQKVDLRTGTLSYTWP